jgi:hypothetical protein
MPNEQSFTAPRAFISYSWSSPSHESWVLNLASRLREDGVDVILDKWDLKPGHDALHFMESMVTDKSVSKVIMICDRTYAEKADAREGGVGTESQIISPEIYRSSTQDKFAAAITENYESGKACTPTFYVGRIYFDFTTGQLFEESYEQLLRWLVDKPQFIKPKLGSIPESLISTEPAATATQSRAKRAEEAIRQAAANSAAYVQEYGDALIPELRSLSPQIKEDEESDEKVIASAESMRPYVRQMLEICAIAIRFSDDERVWDSLLIQLERIGRMMWRSSEITSWNTHQFDSYKMVAGDLFVSIVALALDEGRFDLANRILSRSWLLRESEGAHRQSTSDFTAFNQHIESLDRRNQRLKLNRISIHADLVREAHPLGSIPSFESVMQASFVIFMRSLDDSIKAWWHPFVLVYSSNRFAPFPIFARSESLVFFEKLAPLLSVTGLDQFKERIDAFEKSGRGSQMFSHQGLPVAYLANSAFLGTRP